MNHCIKFETPNAYTKSALHNQPTPQLCTTDLWSNLFRCKCIVIALVSMPSGPWIRSGVDTNAEKRVKYPCHSPWS